MASSAYEIFECAQKNNLSRLEELLDSGVDPNSKDFDQGATPLHYAASNGAKQCLELLVKRGAEINVANKRGVTPLHTLVSKRYDALVLWMIKQGARTDMEDKRGFSARDLALGWFQQEMDDVASGKLFNNDGAAAAAPVQATAAPTATFSEEVMKIHLPSGGHKAIRITSLMTGEDLLKQMASKLNLDSQHGAFLTAFEVKRGREKLIGSGDNLFDIKRRWPMIMGTQGNETHLHCYFLVKTKAGAPQAVQDEIAKCT